MMMILLEWLKIMIKFIKNYGVYIGEFLAYIILGLIAIAVIYYVFWFICLIDHACYQLNFTELV